MLNSTLVTYQRNTVNERLYRTNNPLLQKINKIKTQIKLQRRGSSLPPLSVYPKLFVLSSPLINPIRLLSWVCVQWFHSLAPQIRTQIPISIWHLNYLYSLMTDLPLTMSLLQSHNPLTVFQTKGYNIALLHNTFQFSSVAQSFLTLWDPMNHSTPGLPVHYQLLEFTQTHVHWVGDVIQLSYPLSSPSLPASNLLGR